MTALGQANALTVLAVAEKGAFLHAPDMYMEKLVVDPAARSAIDLAAPLEDNLRAVASRLGKTLSELTVSLLAKPRHNPCSGLGYAFSPFPMATSPRQSSPACPIAKWTSY